MSKVCKHASLTVNSSASSHLFHDPIYFMILILQYIYVFLSSPFLLTHKWIGFICLNIYHLISLPYTTVEQKTFFEFVQKKAHQNYIAQTALNASNHRSLSTLQLTTNTCRAHFLLQFSRATEKDLHKGSWVRKMNNNINNKRKIYPLAVMCIVFQNLYLSFLLQNYLSHKMCSKWICTSSLVLLIHAIHPSICYED